MTNRTIAHARLRNSRLVSDPGLVPLTDAVGVVRWFGAVQSQDVIGGFWALGQRLPASTTVEDVGAAFDQGEIVRTHALRPTWHFLAPDELSWIEALTGPRVRRANDNVGRRLGIDRVTFERASAVIHEALAGGAALTRGELRRPLLEAGIPLDAPNSLAHVVMNAELDGLICSGPRRGSQFTYQLVEDRIPASSRTSLEPEVALRELTVRYFTSHGPALVHDMAWWSGLTVTDVRRGIELAGDALDGRTIDGKPYVASAGGFEPATVPEPHVLLLSNYDEYLGSYTDYSPIFDASLPKERTIADVLGAHIVVRDGLVVGGWRRSLTRDRAIASVTILKALSPSERGALEAEADRWAQFLGLAPELRVTSG